jgi:hypothetical protein
MISRRASFPISHKPQTHAGARQQPSPHSAAFLWILPSLTNRQKGFFGIFDLHDIGKRVTVDQEKIGERPLLNDAELAGKVCAGRIRPGVRHFQPSPFSRPRRAGTKTPMWPVRGRSRRQPRDRRAPPFPRPLSPCSIRRKTSSAFRTAGNTDEAPYPKRTNDKNARPIAQGFPVRCPPRLSRCKGGNR